MKGQRELNDEVRKSLPPSGRSRYRQGFMAAKAMGETDQAAHDAGMTKAREKFDQNPDGQWVRKDQPGSSQAHVDTPGWSASAKPKAKKPAKFLKADQPRRYTLGVVYEPDAVDTQGDFASADEIERACWDFNRQRIGTGQGVTKRSRPVVKGALGIQHQDWDDGHGEILESYIAPCAMVIGEQTVAPGTWLMGIRWSPENWAKIQRGEITGLSMGGRAERVDP